MVNISLNLFVNLAKSFDCTIDGSLKQNELLVNCNKFHEYEFASSRISLFSLCYMKFYYLKAQNSDY